MMSAANPLADTHTHNNLKNLNLKRKGSSGQTRQLSTSSSAKKVMLPQKNTTKSEWPPYTQNSLNNVNNPSLGGAHQAVDSQDEPASAEEKG